MKRETLEQAGYIMLGKVSNGGYVLYNKNNQTYELFHSNKKTTGWAIKYRNTALEFCCTIYSKDTILKPYHEKVYQYILNEEIDD